MLVTYCLLAGDGTLESEGGRADEDAMGLAKVADEARGRCREGMWRGDFARMVQWRSVKFLSIAIQTSRASRLIPSPSEAMHSAASREQPSCGSTT